MRSAPDRAEPGVDGPDQPALHRDQHDADADEHGGHRTARSRPNRRSAEQRERGLEGAEGGRGDEGRPGPVGLQGPPPLGRLDRRGCVLDRRRARAPRRMRLRQALDRHDGVDEGDGGGHEERHARPGRARPARRAPGPSTKPTPKAAPSRPSRRGRSSGGATSVTAAWATDTLAPDAPSMMRPRNSSHSDVAPPVSKLPTAVPNSDTMMTGLRPTRSESRPRSGAKTSWASENEANERSRRVVGDWRRSARRTAARIGSDDPEARRGRGRPSTRSCRSRAAADGVAARSP